MIAFRYIATDPAGRLHEATDADNCEATLRRLRAQFPTGAITLRAEVVTETRRRQCERREKMTA